MNFFFIADYVVQDEANGLFTVKTVLSLKLNREALGTGIECRVETPALENKVINQLQLDLQGKLFFIDLFLNFSNYFFLFRFSILF